MRYPGHLERVRLLADHRMARGEMPRGAVPLERAVDPERFVAEWLRRGIPIQQTVRRPLGA